MKKWITRTQLDAIILLYHLMRITTKVGPGVYKTVQQNRTYLGLYIFANSTVVNMRYKYIYNNLPQRIKVEIIINVFP